MLTGRSTRPEKPKTSQELIDELKYIIMYCKLNEHANDVLYEVMNKLTEGIGREIVE